MRRQAIPNPDCDIFERGCADRFNVVEELMIELGAHLGDGHLKIIEMEDDAGFRVRLALDGHTHMERMAVNTSIGMPRWCGRQKMRSFECEVFID